MGIPTSRDALILYCKRDLGFPVVEINVDDDQVSDRIDEALQFFQTYHFDSMQKVYLKHMITQQDKDRKYIDTTQASGVASTTSGSNVVTGLGTQFAAEFAPGVSLISINGEQKTVTSITSELSLTVDSAFSNTNINEPISNVLANDAIAGVTRIFPISGSSASLNMFDLRYQLRLHDLYDFTSTSYVNFVLTQQHLRTLDMLFSGEMPIRFNKHQNRLYIDTHWDTLNVGDFLILEAYKILDPNAYTEVYNDKWLKRYATALIKKQWGTNMKKFGGLTLPGGVTLQGQQIWEEAMAEIKEIEEQMQSMWEEPPQFILG